ncbi:hypothetical protein CABS01_11715 [Colletotrichum abscissum]|uniref:Heterokaryon incompatibility domain-containing protein n=1 Tax=Colletotrichum abscissum TaxID=1671311 RepID=A0A9P9XK92_9PEZI|nr:uncharacterized protein CABS01_11715 [Colletotrichum abscissum]KAI3554878.1 hypothetical protein CABS02_04717 [Colletotrichum abscissum]KAK1493546.1 hypothetical protein CABS01_11715 [Colletotrichum abscissum]
MARPNEIDEPFSNLALDPSSPPLPLLIKPSKSPLRTLFTRKSPPPLQATPLSYTPLKQNEIRLVNLQAGPPSTPVTLTTETTPLSSAGYTALSYVWGSPSDTLAIYVDNHVFQATRNLHSALQHIRLFLKPSQVIPLWIDAISINQADTTERSHQVSQMREIYTSADLVLTWLDPDLAPGLTYLRELGDHALAVSQNSKGPPKLLPSHVKDRYTTMRETVRVFQSTYWNQVWTVQEYTAPTDFGVFLSGTAWVDRTAFLPATILYTQALNWLRDDLRRRGADASFVDATLARVKKVVHDLKMSYARMAASNESDGSSGGMKAAFASEKIHQVEPSHGKKPGVHRFNLISLLLRFRDLQATDPRDRIYAPLK